ncbi:MAG TPA: hypothetical protein PK390_03940 [Fervidobacterium nodosum]|nr:hypothetical protein [Fervidobacterium nodosum]
MQNLKQYRISVPITVKLGATSTILTERCLETIVTANVYKNGQLVSDLTPYTFIFEPDGA